MAQRTIRLTKAHRHGGRDLQRGAQIVLDTRRASWLVEQGVAEFVDGPSSTRAALFTEARSTTSAREGGAAQRPAGAPTARSWGGCCGGTR